MTTYKLLATDMDGTLLNSQGSIAPKTITAIKRLVSQGVLFTISTGRPIQGVYKYNDLLNLQGPIITYNGAMIVNAQSREVLFEQGLSPHAAKQIFEIGQKYNTTMCIWSDNQLYGNRLDERIYKYQALSGVEPLLLENIDDLLSAGVTKILWYDDAPRIEQFMRELTPNPLTGVTFCTSKPEFLEFFSSQVSKAAALAKIGELYDIDRTEMVAVGDGLNDLAMLEYVGLGVAMGNAAQPLKDIAQFITDTNDKEGVRMVIEKFFV